MSRLILMLLACLCLLAVGAKPYRGMVVNYENVNFGYEGDQTDGILGADEFLTWVAEGQLAPGEQYVYTYLPNNGGVYISARAYTRKGKGELLIEIESTTYLWTGDIYKYSSGLGTACLVTDGYAPNLADWSVTITNIGPRTAKGIYFSGMNQTDFGQECP